MRKTNDYFIKGNVCLSICPLISWFLLGESWCYFHHCVGYLFRKLLAYETLLCMLKLRNRASKFTTVTELNSTWKISSHSKRITMQKEKLSFISHNRKKLCAEHYIYLQTLVILRSYDGIALHAWTYTRRHDLCSEL